jgi:hypothetical protein
MPAAVRPEESGNWREPGDDAGRGAAGGGGTPPRRCAAGVPPPACGGSRATPDSVIRCRQSDVLS